MRGYSDLADLAEDQRIKVIGIAAMAGNIIGIALEDDDEKVRRYLAKLAKSFPKVRHISTDPGLVAGTVLVRVGPEARH